MPFTVEAPRHGPIPARLHVLLASDAPYGVVIRRGPSKHVATILWDRRRDEFRLGQWMKKRIDVQRSDLSPDGKHLLYFAIDMRNREARGSWTAISRAPCLKAIALFPKGDCWHGGGLWTSKDTYWINEGYGHPMLYDTTEVRRDPDYRPPDLPFEYFLGGRGVYYPRLMRDGWEWQRKKETVSDVVDAVFEKPLSDGWILRKTCHRSSDHPGFHWDEHALLHRESGIEVGHSEWEWAEVDGDRVVWAAGGKLFRGEVGPGGLHGESELQDFNGMAFEPIEAPY